MISGISPLVTVVIPVYQVENYLDSCLKSVTTQTYTNLEILVINDGSTDGSPLICQQYASKDRRVTFLSQANRGLSAARNTGLDNAHGEFVLFLDSDDLISPKHIEMLYWTLIENDVDIAITNLSSFENDPVFSDRFGAPEICSAIKAVETIFYQGRFDTSAPGKLYKAQLWSSVRFPEGYVHEDLPTVYRAILNGESCAYRESKTYGYRYRSDGLNHSRTNEKKSKTLSLVDEVVDHVDSHFPELSKAVRCFRCSFCFHLILNSDFESLSYSARDLILTRVHQDRGTVIRDVRARKKTVIACLLSFFGIKTVAAAFRLRK